MISPFIITTTSTKEIFHDSQSCNQILPKDAYNEGEAIKRTNKGGNSNSGAGGGGASIFSAGGNASISAGSPASSGGCGAGGGGGIAEDGKFWGNTWCDGGEGGGAGFQIFF